MKGSASRATAEGWGGGRVRREGRSDARWGKYRRGWPVGVRDEGGVEGHYREHRGLSSSSFIADSILPASLWQMDFHNAETM